MSEYCLAGCILNLLEEKNIRLPEEVLFFSSNRMFFTLYKEGMLCANVADCVTEFCYNNNFPLKKLDVAKTSDLNNILDLKKKAIAKIDTKYLTYGKPYKTNTIEGTTHYILVEDVISEKELFIKDFFIPTRPVTAYSGKLEIDEGFIDSSDFWLVEPIDTGFQNRINKKAIKENVISTLKYEIGEKKLELKDVCVGKKAKQKMIQDIDRLKSLDSDLRKARAYEMGVNLATSGISVTRKYLENYLEREILNNNFKEQIEKIIDDYFTLQLLFVKCYFSDNLKDIDVIVNFMKQISSFEERVFRNILKILT